MRNTTLRYKAAERGSVYVHSVLPLSLENNTAIESANNHWICNPLNILEEE